MLSKFKSTQTKFHLNGKEINLTSDEIAIKSNNFNVDKNGNMTCSNANITGGNIELSSKDNYAPRMKLYNENETDTSMSLTNFGLFTKYQGNTLVHITNFHYNNEEIRRGTIHVYASDNSCETWIAPDKIITPNLTQTSLVENKKNFEKLENALEIIKQVDIYKYNLKNEKDTDKKHLGFVIGDGYNYSKDLTSNNNDGADIYSLASCCLAGLKEAIQQIENMQKEIEKLKGGKANG